MRHRIAFFSMLGLGLMVCLPTMTAGEAFAADCGQGSVDEQVVCLNQKIVDLEAKVAELTKETLKWNDRIALRNEDMRLYPRCLDNPGPNSPDITMVLANSCAKVPAQTWMIAKPYH
jgi:hypothetical protein